MRYDAARRLFEKDQAIEGSFQKFHLPQEAELLSIIPGGDFKKCPIIFQPLQDKRTQPLNQYTRVVKVGHTKVSETGYYKQMVKMNIAGKQRSTTVALRFAGNSHLEPSYRSAWLYFFEEAKPQNGLHIYCINVADNQDITSVNDLTEEWWNKNIHGVVYRLLPAAGNGNSPSHGRYSYYWGIGDTLDGNKKRTACFYFEPRLTFIDHPTLLTVNRSVRLFSYTPVE